MKRRLSMPMPWRCRRPHRASSDAHELVHLQAQAPRGMAETVAQRLLRIFLPQRAIHRLQETQERQPRIALRRRSRLRIDQLQFIARARAGSAPALGLTQSQSIPSGAAIVPLVSTATSNSRACSASISGRSSCSSGSPPVQTTNFFPPKGPPPRPHRSAPPTPLRSRTVRHPAHLRRQTPYRRISHTLSARSSSRPNAKIASCEPAEDSRPSRLRPLALQRVERSLVDRVAHGCTP